MSGIAWMQTPEGGRWGSPQMLQLPCDTRGLLLAEGVFETVLVLNGRPQLLAAHLARWRQGAALLGLMPPPDPALVEPLAQEAIARSGISTGALRLNWCRGSGPRGLARPEPERGDVDSHLFWLQLSSSTPCFSAVDVVVSATEVRQASSLLSRCKSFGYGSALVARRQAALAGADDALLNSSSGELCCGTSANLLVRIDNLWRTPPLASGCLPGIMRERALALGLAQEQTISENDLETGQGAVLLNSLSCRPIRRKGRTQLPGPDEQEASAQSERLWRGLLEP